ncbi:MAG: transcription-repair coupling factor [Chloroflexi bacterium]|nr:transcription-repair coupling factor [Chloroflexota bacterium]
MSPAEFGLAGGWIHRGQQVSPRALMAAWLEAGYEHVPTVEAPGQFAHRGGIVDVFPSGRAADDPAGAYRIEFWGDEIDSIRTVDPATQRSSEQVERALVPPAHEVLARAPALDWPARNGAGPPVPLAARLHVWRGTLGSATLLDYLPPGALVLLDEPRQLDTSWAELEAEAEQLRDELVRRGELPAGLAQPYVGWRELEARLRGAARPVVVLQHDPADETLSVVSAPVFAGRLRAFLDHVAQTARDKPGVYTVVVSRQTARLGELLAERGLVSGNALTPGAEGRRQKAEGSLQPPASNLQPGEADGRRQGDGARPRVVLLEGALAEGWCSEALGVELFTDGELFGLRQVRRPVRRARRAAARDAFLSDLAEGDLVVHVDHGIGRYRGLVRMAPPGEPRPAEAAVRDYLVLEYASSDRLYVPVEQADRVARYVGGGEDAPGLTRLGSGEWSRAKQRVRRAVRDIARELLELYAARDTAEGFAFPPDSAWQSELEAAFPFVETPDQARAIEETRADMERPRPMDRLLVGDVGYGKTEVALRAAFKAVLGGRQVAVLVPTTVLAQQHFNTFRERLGAFPVRVEVLSRFRSERDQRAVVEGLAAGAVDICIGTHRLIQKDVYFKDLGLVIIDEEQRFGVSHKERLKQLRKEVDVLTLTATPIPRTLHMALSGVRDMSTIETAPESRVPIRTYVSEYDERLIHEAIVRELERGGQVYLVHNRVQGIEYVANRLRRLVPEARIAVGHGQMPEEQLERVMLDFADGATDVLVCTTIIESGLDIPNVNTIIVNNAHQFGLAQLYQLRGRVGRSAARAYAYFFYTHDGSLTETAEQRLRTIYEATELGAGFRIAMKDLEIRGAGNLLGAEQSGHISAVGFDLYTRLLAEAVAALRAAQEGRPLPAPSLRAQPSIDLPLEAHLPADYVPDEPLRLNLYQRLAAAADGGELDALVDELEDRFGPLPPPAQHLAYLLGLRLAAGVAGVEEIAGQDTEIVVRFARLPPLDTRRLSRQLGVPLRLGSNQVRLPLDAGGLWMPRLLSLVEAASHA